MGILDLFFPKKCVSCGKFGEYVCSSCFATLSFDVPQRCLVCGKFAICGMMHPLCKTEHAIDGVFCGIVYARTARKLIACLKYAPNVYTVSSLLAQLACESVLQNEAFVSVFPTQPVLVPIPLSEAKLRKRGYNQAYILAKEVGKQLRLPLEDCLQRTKNTTPQFGLTKPERKQNLTDAFALREDLRLKSNDVRIHKSKIVNHKSILLVDDVLTTGATVMEAAKVLKKQGVQKVWALCIAAD